MQTNVFSGIIILEGIMSAKMSGMDVDLELALCYRQSFWIMSWTMTWKFQIRAFDRDHSGWLRMRVNRLKLALFKCDRGSASTKCNWRERFVGKMCFTDFLVPLKPATIALFAENKYWVPSYAKLHLMCQVPLLNVTDCIISFCIVLTVTTSTLYLNKIESSQQYLQIVDQRTEHCRWFSINSVGVNSSKLVCKGPGAQNLLW